LNREAMKEAVIQGIDAARQRELAAREELDMQRAGGPGTWPTPGVLNILERRIAYAQGQRAALESVLNLCDGRKRKR
jgi:hypothetical protein